MYQFDSGKMALMIDIQNSENGTGNNICCHEDIVSVRSGWMKIAYENMRSCKTRKMKMPMPHKEVCLTR